MPKSNKPNSDTEVLEVMKSYCQDKGYTFSDVQLDVMAQSCYLLFESRGWKGITYWPAVVKRWILTNLDKQSKSGYERGFPQHKGKMYKGKSVRDKILESEAEQEDE